MPLAEMTKLSFDALRQRRTRSVLTILMVVVGASLMVALLALSSGFSVFMEEQFSILSPNTLIVTPIDMMGGTGPGMITILDTRVVKNIEKISGVDAVYPIIQGLVTLKAGGATQRVTLMGVDQEKTSKVVPTFELEEGTLVYPYDTVGITVGNKVKYPPGSTVPFVTLGQSVIIEYSRSVYEEGVPKIVVENKNFIVRGSVANLGAGMMIPLDNSIGTSLRAADAFFDKKGQYDTIIVITESSSLNQQVEDEIRKIYGKNIGVTSASAITETFQTLVSGLSVFILGIAGVSLLVAAVGIVTTLITSVMERTREIGLLKALGFKNRQIMLLFLLEATIIGLIGATVGLAFGFLLGNGMPSLMNFQAMGGEGMENGFAIIPNFLPSDLMSIWVFAVILSATAGLYPAWRASRLDPVDALRKEL